MWAPMRGDRGLPAQHIYGWFEIATVALRSDDESLDSADMYAESSTELKRCALAGVGHPTREAWPVPHPPRRARGSRAVNRPKIVLRCRATSTIGNAAFLAGRRQHASSQMRLRARRGTQHSSSRNIGRHMLRATYGD